MRRPHHSPRPINGGTKLSSLSDVTRDNVGALAPAWEWRPDEAPLEAFGTRPGNFQNTPLMIGNVVYVTTPYNRVVALEAESGRELWNSAADHSPSNPRASEVDAEFIGDHSASTRPGASSGRGRSRGASRERR